MDKETKKKLKQIIDNLENDDNVFLITNNVCCIIGRLRNISRNFILASLKNDVVNNLMELLNLERGNEK